VVLAIKVVTGFFLVEKVGSVPLKRKAQLQENKRAMRSKRAEARGEGGGRVERGRGKREEMYK